MVPRHYAIGIQFSLCNTIITITHINLSLSVWVCACIFSWVWTRTWYICHDSCSSQYYLLRLKIKFQNDSEVLICYMRVWKVEVGDALTTNHSIDIGNSLVFLTHFFSLFTPLTVHICHIYTIFVTTDIIGKYTNYLYLIILNDGTPLKYNVCLLVVWNIEIKPILYWKMCTVYLLSSYYIDVFLGGRTKSCDHRDCVHHPASIHDIINIYAFYKTSHIYISVISIRYIDFNVSNKKSVVHCLSFCTRQRN